MKNELLGGWDVTNVTLLETGPWLTPEHQLRWLGAERQRKLFGTERPVEYQRCESWRNLAAGCGVATSSIAGSPGAVLQPGGVFADTRGSWAVRQCWGRNPPGPGTAAVSLGVAKEFRITEKVHARFETTFTNVLNHTNFAPPVTAMDSLDIRSC